MGIYLAVCVVCAIPMLIKALQVRRPLQTTADNPPRLAGHFADRTVYTFTGVVKGSSTRSNTTVTGTVSGTSGSLVGGVTSRTTVTNSFRLVNPETGEEQNFQVTEMRAQIWDGQMVSVAWAIRQGKSSGPYLVVFNHSTKQSFFSDTQLRLVYMKKPLGVGPVLYGFFFLIWNVVGIVLLLTWSFTLSRRVKRFKRSGVTPLLGTLNATSQRLSTFTGQMTNVTPSPPVSPQPSPAALQAAPVPGWYPVDNNPHKQAWWSGEGWTSNVEWINSAWVEVPSTP
jgi:hypothetical protein